MLIRVGHKIAPEVGGQFYHYILRDAYNKGEIIQCTETTIQVDFGDTIYEYDLEDCSTVYSAGNKEHLMTCGGGRLVRDMRPKENAPISSLEDLLDFSWMDCPDG